MDFGRKRFQGTGNAAADLFAYSDSLLSCQSAYFAYKPVAEDVISALSCFDMAESYYW